MKAWRTKGAWRRKIGALLIVALVLGMMPGNGIAAVAEEAEEGTGETGEKIDLSKAAVVVSGSYIYTGKPITLSPESIVVSLGGITIPASEYMIVYEENTVAGTARISIKPATGSKYTGSVSGSFFIEKATPDIGIVTAGTIEDTLEPSDILLKRTNEKISGTLRLKENSNLIYGENSCIWEFTPNDIQNYKTVTGSVMVVVKDTISPTAKYQIKGEEERELKKSDEENSGRVFCKAGTMVKIIATDDTEAVSGSGIQEIQYVILESKEANPNPETLSWKKYENENQVQLNATGSCILYVKITDNQDNKAVLKSETLVVYGESSVSPTSLEYTYKASTDVAISLFGNGNTIKELSDEKGTILDKEDYTFEEGTGKLTLKAAYLDMLETGGHKYTVKLYPQAATEEEREEIPVITTDFTIQVKKRKLTVKEVAAESKPYDGTDSIKITKIILDGIAEGDNISVELDKVKGALDSPNAGIYSSVHLSGLALTGAAIHNYIWESEATVPTSKQVEVTKKDGYPVEEQTKKYLYSKVKKDSIKLDSFLPNNCGTVTYGAVCTGGTITYKENPTINQDGNLSYTVSSGAVGAKGTIEIVAETQNYTDITIKINLELTDKIPVELKGDMKAALANNNLTYGEVLSKIDLEKLAKDYKITFVDDEGTQVEGKLQWKNSAISPNAGNYPATWVFTPDDTSQYEITEDLVTITVNKAIPYIATLPTPSAITYGETLGQSTLEGEIVKHGNGNGASGESALSGNAITGSFRWKDASIKPTVADSGKTEYIILFIPSGNDAMNYEQVEAKVTLIVNKAANPSPMPSSTITVPADCKTVGEVPLGIANWEWKDSDKNVALVEGTRLAAVANYVGVDKDNYETVTMTITIIKSSSGTSTDPTYPTYPSYPSGIHQHFFSSKITKDPTCTEKGLRTYSCLCGSSYTEELEALGSHQYSSRVTKQPTATEEGVRTYTCDRCKASYTEPIAKLGSGKEEKPSEDKTPDTSETTVSKADQEKNSLTLNTKLTIGQIGSKLYVEWGRISGADGYDVYVQYCGKDFTSQPAASVKGTERAKVAISKIDGKKLDLKKNYKVYVAAYKLSGGKKVSLGKSITAHGIGRENKAYTNAREITLKKDSYSLQNGKTATISATTVLDDKNKKMLSDAHAKEFRYASSNKKVATVSSAGKIKAVGEGSCTVYVYSRNGYAKTVKVTVK